VRLFLAVDLPAAARAAVAEVQTRLQPLCPGWRWTEPESVHLTLRFLGEVAPADDTRRRAVWRAAADAAAPFELRLRRVGVFPGARQPRILWAGVDDLSGEGRLTGLARSIEDAARADGVVAETRAFRPHLTLARAARGGRPVSPPDGCVGTIAAFRCGEIVLFCSELFPSGARYTAVESFALGSGT
jgi:2'-5' RNA ligase